MLIDSLYGWLVLVGGFHLAVFGLALLVLGLSALARATLRFWFASSMTQSTRERIDEIRSIGEQARQDMKQLSFAFLYTISNHKRR